MAGSPEEVRPFRSNLGSLRTVEVGEDVDKSWPKKNNSAYCVLTFSRNDSDVWPETYHVAKH